MEKQVAIVGAGISGLLACKYMLSKGFRPIVFEASNVVGGVWTKTVETTKIQTPRVYYQFSNFPWPSSVTEDHPTQNQVLDYVQSYARHFDCLKHIKFNTKVCGIEYEGSSREEMQSWSLWGGTEEPFDSNGKWKVTVEDKQSLSTEVYVVDFVILCNGRFSDVPNIPEFPPNKGPEAFQGKVIHSMDYAAMDYDSAAKFVTGKQVTVIRFQKFAMECSNANGVHYYTKGFTRRFKTVVSHFAFLWSIEASSDEMLSDDGFQLSYIDHWVDGFQLTLSSDRPAYLPTCCRQDVDRNMPWCDFYSYHGF